MTSTQAFKRCIACLSSLLFFMTTSLVQAAPGAHGPNGEHLDTVQQSAGSQASAPRLDAKSELFELVATLSDDKLSILIDRFDTNEPVLRASVEVESGNLKAPAAFHEDLGDYRVEDAQLLKQLREAGEHPLVFTVSAGSNSDLLDGVLRVSPVAAGTATEVHGHMHGEPSWLRWIFVVQAFIVVGILLSWRGLARRKAMFDGGKV
ncbi:hypothetical protein [Delftia tsuruhatensis]|uniref:hypothetical protein n=1 Tax=Delftia tsuruhatensis TaxID=180282 RepID=UPI000DB2A273|nr:hypothetical protein [Delftia tsuruhatensis]PZP73798.1 MAG: hypothetical protein DI604_11120 [Delftia acidovorans]TDF24053.1 hypothetical protein EZI45_22870 [Delftia tsuruhatensis]